MKTYFFFFFLFLLTIQSCIVPGRFAGSNAPLPAGMAGADFGFVRSFSLDTSNYQVSSFSIGVQMQEESGDFTFNYGLVNIFSPYAGLEYRFLKFGASDLKTGFNIGFVDGMVAIPLKANIGLNERFNLELNLRYAGSIYKRDYESLYKDGLLISGFDKSSLAPWYLGGDVGLNFDVFEQNNIGIRVGHYWYKNALDQKVDRLLILGINTMLVRKWRRFRFRPFF